MKPLVTLGKGSFLSAFCLSMLAAAWIGSTAETTDVLQLKYNRITLPNGEIKLSLSYFTDSKHNYVVEYRDIPEDTCRDWQPLPNAPHNYGIVFTTNTIQQRLYRLRRIDEPQAKLYALLQNDTGVSSMDRLTGDPTITGLALQFPAGTVLEAALDSQNGPFIPIATLGKPQYFKVTRQHLDQLSGGSTAEGAHVVILRAVDLGRNTLAQFMKH